ncbi:hypothetical protein [Streptomyces sp. NPDC059970]|uniref:hypothetical protein n=1 Tax=Streptomyces sp. NPDC059970 TaxID=3347019 RepID=UPI003697D823
MASHPRRHIGGLDEASATREPRGRRSGAARGPRDGAVVDRSFEVARADLARTPPQRTPPTGHDTPAAERPAVPVHGLAVLDGLVAATTLTMGRLLPAGA